MQCSCIIKKHKPLRNKYFIILIFNICIRLCAEHSSRLKDSKKEQNEQSRPAHHSKRKFQAVEILAGARVQPTRTSPATICVSLSPVPTTSVYTSIYSIETSARSILETNEAADLLPQTKKSPTRTFAPFSNPSAKKKETAAHSETGGKKKLIRNKRWHTNKNETANITEVLRHHLGVSPEPREPSTAAAGAGVIFSPHFEQDKTPTYNFSLPNKQGLINCCH